jgi:hypothetical protein
LQSNDCVHGLRITHDYLTAKEESDIMSLVDDIMNGGGGGAVVTALKRRVTAHYGYEFDYKLRSVNPSAPLSNTPAVVQAICERLYE